MGKILAKLISIVLFQIWISIVHGGAAFATTNCDWFFTRHGLQTQKFTQANSILSSRLEQEIATFYKNRNSTEHLELDALLAKIHAEKEMSFQVKNPQTGFYDKFVEVPIESRVALIEQKNWNRLVDSTGPVLRLLRSILQKVYSTYDFNSESLGLSHLNAGERELVLKTIKESIYFEPALISAEMKDYPFLSVAGFDGAIGNPRNPEPVFFEMNLGTPSGLSNNTLLLESLKDHDPIVFNRLRGHLPTDDTFEILRRTIEDNARFWTGIYGGLSVVVSPGVYNGAHPDVAEIARRTGMPLVELSDLYLDENYNVRLNTGRGNDHPLVTGVYGRMEESFFLQNSGSEPKVPMVNPAFVEINKTLSQKLKIKLRPGAVYKYILDSLGNRVDVERDGFGRPIIEDLWTGVGTNPLGGEKVGPRSLVNAIKNRKLYFSGLGGRVVDDKRLFSILSNYLSTQTDEVTARPVDSLPRDLYRQLTRSPESFVVKEPGNSGGQGIYFLGQMNPDEQKRIVAKVLAVPDQYEVQLLRSPTTVDHYAKSAEGQIIKSEVVTDLRIFVMMDSEGRVSAGPNSLLLRTGRPDSFFSNTSQGGGYGIGVVFTENARPFGVMPQRTSTVANAQVSTAAREEKASQSLDLIWTILQKVYGHKQGLTGFELENLDEVARDIQSVVILLRENMDIFPPELRSIIGTLRNLQNQLSDSSNKSETLTRVHLVLTDFIKDQVLDKVYFGTRYRQIFQDFIDRKSYLLTIDHGVKLPDSFAHRAILPRIRFEHLKSPEVFYTVNIGVTTVERVDSKRIVGFDSPPMQSFLEEIQSMGGELRFGYEKETFADASERVGPLVAGFWVNYTKPNLSSYLKPVINFDPSAPRAYATLAHEMSHFRDWKEKYLQLRSLGLSEAEAATDAQKFIEQEDQVLFGERRAVDAEIAAEKLFRDGFNRPRLNERASRDWDLGIVNRRMYPEFEATRRVLNKVPQDDGSKSRAKELIKIQVLAAVKAKEKALTEYKKEMKPEQFKSWESATAIDLLVLPFGIERLVQDRTLPLFLRIYEEVLFETGLPTDVPNSKMLSIVSQDRVLFEAVKARGHQNSNQQQ